MIDESKKGGESNFAAALGLVPTLGQADSNTGICKSDLSEKAIMELFRERRALRARVAELERENTALRGITPELPPRSLHGEGDGMPRYGLRFNGPTEPLSVPMADGYWTPWHLAQKRVVELERDLKAANAELERWRHGREIEGDYVCPDSLRADAAEQRAKRLEGALRRIADPVAHFRAEAERTGSALNGMMANSLSNNADYLKQEARAALAASESEAPAREGGR